MIYVKPPRTDDPKEMSKFFEEICRYLNAALNRVSAVDADSTAADVATIVADHNDLLAKLRTAGLLSE